MAIGENRVVGDEQVRLEMDGPCIRSSSHTEGEITALEYTGLPDLIDRFQTEVNELYARRTD